MNATLDMTTDPYHSRVAAAWEAAPRVDPVVWGDADATSGPLDPQRAADYDRDGYLLEDQLFSANETAGLLAEAERLAAEAEPGPGVIIEPGSRAVRSLFRLHESSDVFRDVARDPRLLDVARQLLGGEVYVHQSRINFKPAFDGKEFFWHSDFETWHAEDGMPSMHAVSASIVLTDNHHFNGPLMLIPGSHKVFVPCLGATPDDHHKQSLKTQEFGVPGNDVLQALIERGGIEAPTGKAGGLILFDCNTLHGSNANMSPDPRSNVFFVYNRRDNVCDRPYAARRRRPSFLAHGPGETWTP